MERCMKSRRIYSKIQGWVGSLFLVMSAVFIFMSFFSLSAAFADPIQVQEVATSQAGIQSPRGARTNVMQRSGAVQQPLRGSRLTRPLPVDEDDADDAQKPAAAVSSRTSTTSGAAVRGVAIRGNSAASRTSSAARSIRTRGSATAPGATQSRSIVARSGTQARVALSGSAIRASTGSRSQLSTLSSKLSTVTFTNLIDPATGMLSADVYSTCLESYYTCMDEICTARVPGQRRCACAGRIKTFNQVEATLQTAKEDLLRVSGELSMLIMTKGESIRSAFELTDAEISLNCVSYRDMMKGSTGNNSTNSGGLNTMQQWCKDHLMTNAAGDSWDCSARMTTTCNAMYGQGSGNAWMDILNGADSDILTSLQTYADTLNQVNTFTYEDTNNLWGSLNNIDLIVNGSNSLLQDNTTSADRLAQTWGYDLYQYGHNNVCGRVLDSCFNGVFEMCGARPANQGGGSGPYNMNSKIEVNDNDIEFVSPTKGTSSNIGTPACFGYAATAGDPYADLRRPIAAARLSILQKYVLDANSDCDIYGDELKKQAQNMGYQKIAATQLLQKKRLEFAQEKENNRQGTLATAKQNFLKCIDEIQQCRQDKNKDQAFVGNTIRIKNFCNQMSNVPTCYEQMVCDQEATELKASSSANDRNTVLLSEIVSISTSPAESCMLNTLNVPEIRSWTAPPAP